MYKTLIIIKNSEVRLIMLINPNTIYKPPIIIVGAGIAGSLAALEAKSKGHNVIVITKHQPVRSNRVRLDTSLIDQFSKWKDPTDAEDEIFFTKFVRDETINKTKPISLKTIEKFLVRKMNQRKIPIIYDEIHQIDTKDYSLTIQNKGVPIRIPFRHIVDASGTARVVFKKLARCKPSVESLGTPKYASQGAITLVWDPKNKDISKYAHKTDDIKPMGNLNNLKKLGWKKKGYPQGYIATNKAGNKFYLVREIPSKCKSYAEVTKWFKYILSSQYNIPSEELVVLNNEGKRNSYINKFGQEEADRRIEASKKIAVTSFPLKLTRLITPILDLNTENSEKDQKEEVKNAVVAIGDANQDSYFYLGHGATDAAQSAYNFVDSLDENGNLNIKKFAKDIDECRQKHVQMLFNLDVFKENEFHPSPIYGPRERLFADLENYYKMREENKNEGFKFFGGFFKNEKLNATKALLKHLLENGKEPHFDKDLHIGPLTQGDLGEILKNWVKENKVLIENMKVKGEKSILPQTLYEKIEMNLKPNFWLLRAK